MKGLSVQTGVALGGLFQTYTGADPYERIGFLQPALSATELTAPTTNPIKVITPATISNVAVALGHSSTKLYKYLRNSPYTQTDLTASINVSAAVVGAVMWKGKYVYAQPTDLRSWDLNVTDVQILANSNTYSTLDIRKLVVGADKNLYILDGDSVAKCVINTGTAGNALNSFAIDSDHITRDGLNDGRYLVVLADTNAVITTSRVAGTYSCRMYCWDMAKTTADVIWEFPGESYLIGCAKLDGEIIVFGYNGIYVCNSVTPPKLIGSFLGNSTLAGKRPLNPYQITASPTAVLWGDGAANGQNVWAYGKLPGSSKKQFYCPYVTHASTYAHTALSYSAGAVFAAVDTPKLFLHNVGSTRGTATIQTAPIQMPQPFRYGYAKVTLRDKLTSGQAVSFNAATAGGIVVSDTETKSYSAANPRKNLKFDMTAASGSTAVFEDLAIYLTAQAGALVERVSVYGTPLDDANQDL